MMEWSTPSMCWLWRQLSHEARLYSEMVVTGALLHGKAERFLKHYPGSQPLALQLGGSQPADLARCAKMGEAAGYAEINLNVGCPSDRVQNGMIGAILMQHPRLVTDCLSAMRDAVDIPVTIKHRLGVDDHDSYDFARDFVGQVATSGVNVFIVHARKALLKGLSPKENRDIPPLRYDWVYRLKQDFPHLTIVLNGGLTELDQCQDALAQVDGVMLGRAAYHNPMIMAQVDQQFFAATREAMTAEEAVNLFIEFMASQPDAIKHHAKHLMGFFQGVPGGKQFRRHLSENMHRADADVGVVRDALALVTQGRRR